MATGNHRLSGRMIFLMAAAIAIIIFIIVTNSLLNELVKQGQEPAAVIRQLRFYPIVQLAVMLALAGIVYIAVSYTNRADRARLWAGLSKETAHQLGTPISSLMAWTEYLRATGADKDATDEIEKDVKRLSVIADRFQKVGSEPELRLEYVNETVRRSMDYMERRISRKVDVEMNLSDSDHGALLCAPLFEWVIENLTKNAVDAMGGEGHLAITTGACKGHAWIEVADTGKGISRKNFKRVFEAGYSTKKRGWGLGLTLAKRIIEDFHHGRIYVKDSSKSGTTFHIDIPLA